MTTDYVALALCQGATLIALHVTRWQRTQAECRCHDLARDARYWQRVADDYRPAGRAALWLAREARHR